MSSRERVQRSTRPSAAGEVDLRPIVHGDLAEVIAIERRVYRTPWSLAMFLLELSKRDTLGLAARVGGRLCGYAVCSRFHDDWHLMTLAVEPSLQRNGVGQALLRELIGRLDDAHLVGAIPEPRITLEVRRSNEPAIRLYTAHGFLPAGVRPGYYADSREDALILWRTPATLRGELTDIPGTGP